LNVLTVHASVAAVMPLKSTMPPLALNVGAPEIVKAAPRCMVPDVAVNAPLDNVKAPATDIVPDDPEKVPPDIAKVVASVMVPDVAVKAPLVTVTAPATDIDPDDPRNVPPDIAKVVERVVLPEGAVKVPLDKTNAPLVVSVA
jgi:hypothetical protein